MLYLEHDLLIEKNSGMVAVHEYVQSVCFAKVKHKTNK